MLKNQLLPANSDLLKLDSMTSNQIIAKEEIPTITNNPIYSYSLA
jgi:hypothetical protein